MRIQINTFGTEGDIRPFVALARGLTAAGHQAAICTADGYGPLVTGGGVEHLALDDTARILIKMAMPTMGGPSGSVQLLRRMIAAMRQMIQDEWAAAQAWKPDVIVYHPKCLGALHIAERLDLPAVVSLSLPFFTPTGAFPIPFIGHWPLGARANRASYLFNNVTMLAYGAMINNFRRQTLGLAARPRIDNLLSRDDGSPVPVLYSFSRHIVPVPDDYPGHAHVTGSWFDDRTVTWEPSPELEHFLAAGDPPVYVGFGSMGFGRSSQQRTELLLRTLIDTGHRVIMATGWGGLTATTGGIPADQVQVVESIPHDWLFPRTRAVIHHGGAGTTGAGLRAGRPTLICPVLGDQPFWGHQVHRIGAGPAPIPQRRLTKDRFESAVHQLADDRIRRNAADLGQLIHAEDGIAKAIAVIEELR